jgi:hypothetical protein
MKADNHPPVFILVKHGLFNFFDKRQEFIKPVHAVDSLFKLILMARQFTGAHGCPEIIAVGTDGGYGGGDGGEYYRQEGENRLQQVRANTHDVQYGYDYRQAEKHVASDSHAPVPPIVAAVGGVMKTNLVIDPGFTQKAFNFLE